MINTTTKTIESIMKEFIVFVLIVSLAILFVWLEMFYFAGEKKNDDNNKN